MRASTLIFLLLIFIAAIMLAANNQAEPDPSRCVDIIQCKDPK